MKFITILFLLLGTQTAYSCRVTRELSDDLKKSSDVVFVGEAIEYGLEDKNKAKIKFKTLKTIRGKRKAEWEVLWDGHLFKIPVSLSEFTSMYGKKTEVGLDLKGKQPIVVNRLCSESYLLKL